MGFTNGLSQDGHKWIGRTTTIKCGRRKVIQKKFYLGTSEQNEQAARDWLANQERIRAGLGPVLPGPDTLQQLVKTYLEIVRGRVKPITLDGYNRLLSTILNGLGQSHSLHLTQHEVDEYCQNRVNSGAGRVIAKELNSLRCAMEEFHLPVDWTIPRYISRIKKQQAHVPSVSEYKSLLANLSLECSLAVSMALLAGFRNEEVYRARWEHYSQAEGLLELPASIRKNNVGNVVPVVETLGVLLDTTQQRKDCSLSGTIIPTSKSTINTELRKASKRVGIKTWYGLQPARRLLVTLAEDAGWGSDQISLVTGHARKSMASRYSSPHGRIELKRKILKDVEEGIM